MQIEHCGACGEHVGERHPRRRRRTALQRIAGALARQPQDFRFGGRFRDNRCARASGSGRAALPATGKCLPARSGSASPSPGTAAATDRCARPTVTWRSPIASSRADCTLAGARLISSASRIGWKIGPGWNSKRPSCGRQTSVPVRSAGSRSGVNWTRAKSASSRAASARIALVLARPGRAFDQQVAVGQQRDQQALDQRRLADDLGRKRVAQGAEGVVQAVGYRRCGCPSAVAGSGLWQSGPSLTDVAHGWFSTRSGIAVHPKATTGPEGPRA